MSENIITLYSECKSEAEKRSFIETQHITISELIKKNAKLLDEVAHLKQLLMSSTPILGEHKIEKVVVTPEETLIETQIEILQSKGFEAELDLEDIKKFDLLLKNKQLIKEKTIKADSRPILSNTELLNLVKKLPSPSAPK